MRTKEKEYELFLPDDVDMLGNVTTIYPLGSVRCAISYLSGEESTDEDMERSRLRYTGAVRRECSPSRGFSRGMRLVSGDRAYTVCSARLEGRLWILALERCVLNGDCDNA